MATRFSFGSTSRVHVGGIHAREIRDRDRDLDANPGVRGCDYGSANVADHRNGVVDHWTAAFRRTVVGLRRDRGRECGRGSPGTWGAMDRNLQGEWFG